MATPPKLPPAKASGRSPALDAPFLPGDRIPVPEVVKESSSDTDWATFTELQQRQEAKFSDTVPGFMPPPFAPTQDPMYAATKPMGLPTTRDSDPPPPPAAAGVSFDVVMLEARKLNRVCPRPRRWQQLYEMLPGRKVVNGEQHPPPPILGPAWGAVPPLAKRLCFREHLEWADSHGELTPVFGFLKSLTEEEWLHMGDD